jgi:hypothetical protein
MKWFVTSFDGSESGDLKLFPGDLLLHFRTALLGDGKPEILDLWQMKEEGQLWFATKEKEMPPGFELHPTEVCGALLISMRQKLNSGWKPGDIVWAPNIWCVRAGDRMALVGERPWVEGVTMYGIFDFKTSALAYWLRADGEMPLMEEALAAAPSDGDAKSLEWAQRAYSKVAAMGIPGFVDENWSVG